MRLSGFHMPRWWQRAWRARYPMTVEGTITVRVPSRWNTNSGGVIRRTYRIVPMRCGCGYIVYRGSDRIGPHRPTLGGAIRQARRHARG